MLKLFFYLVFFSIISIYSQTDDMLISEFSFKDKETCLKETENKSYTDLNRIKKEIDEAKNTFRKYKWPTIDVTRKSVEETAASVIKIYEIYKQNG